MNGKLRAKSSIEINARISEVWEALTDPAKIKQYMFGTNVISDWKEGSQIKWKGEWQGKLYEDKGKILKFKPENSLAYSHFSPLSGLQDIPENYHTVTIDLFETKGETRVLLLQDNNPTESAREHSEQNWNMMLESLKKFIENK